MRIPTVNSQPSENLDVRSPDGASCDCCTTVEYVLLGRRITAAVALRLILVASEPCVSEVVSSLAIIGGIPRDSKLEIEEFEPVLLSMPFTYPSQLTLSVDDILVIHWRSGSEPTKSPHLIPTLWKKVEH
jgi:hypothetical protein